MSYTKCSLTRANGGKHFGLHKQNQFLPTQFSWPSLLQRDTAAKFSFSTLSIRMPLSFSAKFFHMLEPQPLLLPGAILSQIEDFVFALALVRFLSVPFLQLVQVPLNCSLCSCILSGITCKEAECLQLLIKTEQYQPG